MICNNCGKKITNNCKFCTHCGQKVVIDQKNNDLAYVAQSKSKNEKKKKEISKSKILSISILCILIITIGIFKTQISSIAYKKIALISLKKDFAVALSWAEKAYEIDKDSKIIEEIYFKQANEILDKNPSKAREYLLKASDYSNNNNYRSLIANTYIKDAETKINSDTDRAIELIDKAMEYEKTDEIAKLYVKAYLKKSEKLVYEDIDGAIECLKIVLKHDNSKENIEKIIGLYLKKAKITYESDMESAVEIANEARIYGQAREIEDFLEKAKMEIANQNVHESDYDKTSAYILPYSHIYKVSYSDISNLNKWQLKLARNEIFARHGYVFKTKEIREYFESKSWYIHNTNFDNSDLSEIEKYNAEFIKEYE